MVCEYLRHCVNTEHIDELRLVSFTIAFFYGIFFNSVRTHMPNIHWGLAYLKQAEHCSLPPSCCIRPCDLCLPIFECLVVCWKYSGSLFLPDMALLHVSWVRGGRGGACQSPMELYPSTVLATCPPLFFHTGSQVVTECEGSTCVPMVLLMLSTVYRCV